MSLKEKVLTVLEFNGLLGESNNDGKIWLITNYELQNKLRYEGASWFDGNYYITIDEVDNVINLFDEDGNIYKMFGDLKDFAQWLVYTY